MKKTVIIKCVAIIFFIWMLFKIYEQYGFYNHYGSINDEVDEHHVVFAEKMQSKNYDKPGKYVTYIHMDLKGAPPKLDYFSKLFDFFVKCGAHGILMEYEDMFPYEGRLSTLRAKNCYSKLQIEQILDMAKIRHLDIIPLVQTFGHLEFVLKNSDFAPLREVSNDPCCLSPVNPEAINVVQEMVDQIINMHPSAKAIHIGCDEVNNLGQSSNARNFLSSNDLTVHGLFFRHVKTIAGHIKAKKPNMNVIIWDDMMRGISAKDLKVSNYFELNKSDYYQGIDCKLLIKYFKN